MTIYEPTHFEIVDSGGVNCFPSPVVVATVKTRRGAYRNAEKRNHAYGSHRYYARPVYPKLDVASVYADAMARS